MAVHRLRVLLASILLAGLGSMPNAALASPFVAVPTAPSAEAVAAEPVDPRLVTLTPTRIVDSRVGVGAAKGSFQAGRTVTIAVAGRGGVPATGVASVVVNITAVGAKAAGFVTVHPAGQARPTASNVNFGRGQTISNTGMVRLGATGSISVYVSATTDLLVDATGYHPVGSTFTAVSPTRVLDTRQTFGPWPPGPGDVVANVRLTGKVPASARAVALTVTAVTPATAGYLTVFPEGGSRGETSNVNFAKGFTTAGQVITQIGHGGSVRVHVAATSHVLVDVAGYFSASSEFTPVEPSRLLDTRSSGRVATGGSVTLDLTGLAAVRNARLVAPVLTVTTTGSTGTGFLTVHDGGARPVTSSLNFSAGQSSANLSIVRPDARPSVTIYSSTSTHVIVDVVGYVAASPQLGHAVEVTAAGSHACARTRGGAAFCWGHNAQGQLGDGSTTRRTRATAVAGLGAGVAQVDTTFDASCAVRTTNEMLCWGDNTTGALGLPQAQILTTPTSVLGPTAEQRRVALGENHGCAVTGEAVGCWGKGFGAPTPIAGLGRGVAQVAAGLDFQCIRSTVGEVLCWGDDGWGQLSNGPEATDGRPGRIVPLPARAVQVAATASTACATLINSETWCWGQNQWNIRGDGSPSASAEPRLRTYSSSPMPIELGPTLGCEIDPDFDIATCSGVISGIRDDFRRIPPGTPRSAVSMGPGQFFVCTALRDGRVVCQGRNTSGQLGDGTTTDRTTAANVLGFD